jgi:TatD DNase family protein
MIDAHCHLADETFAADLDEVVSRAKAAGLERVLVVLEAGNDQEARQAARVGALWPEVRFTIGVHPHAAREFSGDPQRVMDTVRDQIVRMPGARAVGEIGLDYHYDYSPRSVQKAVFRAQVRLARELDLPVVIHTREADVDTINLLKEEGKGQVRGVLHCFSGTPALAKAGLDLGLYLSFAGIVTFHRAADLRDTAKAVPLDRLLVETDSPFLAPVPHRGKRNEPAYLPQVVAVLAQVYHTDVSVIAQRTTENFHTLFRP